MTEYLYGHHSVIECMRAGRRKIHEIFLVDPDKNPEIVSLARSQKIPLKHVEKHFIEKQVRDFKHQGIAAKVDSYSYVDFDDLDFEKTPSFIIACDSMTDPQNFGALCRSAYCFGVEAILLPKDRSVEVTPAVVATSAGACEHLKISRVVNLVRSLESLKEKGYWIFAADQKAKNKLEHLKTYDKVVVVAGSEGEGLRPLVSKCCDDSFSIPMKGNFDSLNVAQAMTIVCYELSKRGPSPLKN
ncbi:MAG TPA: 23S rRNA (guanosine(2251)-2'-O)-methyltransferase RlmB [Deltaproteobacteria bacterium]|nr:MAG: 23S rRNA (guanosine(2251)-2'-O)-methyltransferase RlmB [Deltaproteobacteria bacterium GWA2_45_12]HBF12379.1 23S rRNA (guanosine(2251)-2'-O)-methyltransferase RlmB [Deltaproteobacteria bacterium]